MKNETSSSGIINGYAKPPNMLDAVDDLLRSGLEERQAKAIVRMQYQLVESHLATKKDIEIVKKDLKIWMGSVAIASLGILVALGKLGLLTPL